MRTLTNRAVDDIGNGVIFILGLILAASPYVTGRAGEPSIAWSAWISGTVIAVTGLLAIVATFEWEEALTLLVGAWVAVSPWTLGFSDDPSMMWLEVAIGAAVVALSSVELWRLHRIGDPRAV